MNSANSFSTNINNMLDIFYNKRRLRSSAAVIGADLNQNANNLGGAMTPPNYQVGS